MTESSNGSQKLGTHNSKLTMSPGSLVVVTGVNGFVGSHIADQLLQYGYRVRGTVRSISKNQWVKPLFEQKYGPGKFELLEVSDMVQNGAFDEAAKGASGFVHCAAPIMDTTDPHVTVPVAVDSTIRFLESAAKEPMIKRVVLTSSSGACTYFVPNKVFTVDSDTWNEASVEKAYGLPPPDVKERLRDVYFASKTKAEQAAWQWMREHQPAFALNTVIPSANFGASIDPVNQGYRTTGLWIPALLEMGEGLRMKDFPGLIPQYYVNVRDDATLHVAALVYPDVQGERLFAFAYPYDWNSILHGLRTVCPERRFGEDVSDVPKDQSKVANERAEELLKRCTGHGWTSLDQSIKENTEGLVLT
ncbi:aldehyde reductase [Hypoxylon fragiforme]|uniref:aldehyde reductase n=1 Tax=Hypoxylon fragiforme TaxID=63214 RepID=UPI0020C5C728|nr:aldehyde reductase [Hypoxylon fragiforme]KAI2603966.1 aldehyde reductase [Hypoxylon fragiforme]